MKYSFIFGLCYREAKWKSVMFFEIMQQIINWVFENIFLLIILVLPPACYVWYKIKQENLKFLTLPFFVIGIILVSLGAIISGIAFSTQKTIQILLLQDMEVAGKFIPIGYCFILISVIFFVDSALERVFKTDKKDKT